jgi:hypothetical protein
MSEPEELSRDPLQNLHRRRFQTGQFVITPTANNELHPHDVLIGLGRHAQCDWGDSPKEDRLENDRALHGGGRLFSVYRDRSDTKFWIITEADRSVTTVLLPSDY